MGNCFGSDASQEGASSEMGKTQSKSSQGSLFSRSSKKRSEDNGFPSDIFSDDLTPERAKKIKVDPAQIEFGFKRAFHEEYEVTKLLGKGAFASAYQVTPRENSRFFGRYDLAVKVISKTSLKTVQDVRWLKQEIDIMRLVGGSINMVHVYECYESKNHVYILMELCSGKTSPSLTPPLTPPRLFFSVPNRLTLIFARARAGGNLFEKISKGDPYTEKMAAVLMGDILRVAEQCHSRGIIHRDIKPENFLFGNKLMGAPLKMTDFGLADYCKPSTKLTEIRCVTHSLANREEEEEEQEEGDGPGCPVLA